MPTRNAESPPGSLYPKRGRWYWSVRLPGTPARRAYPLIPGGRLEIDDGAARVLQPAGMPRMATTERAAAAAIAWELWRQAATAAAAGPAAGPLRMAELVARYLDHARTYYRNRDGEPTGEADNLALALRPAADRWGDLPAAEFEARHLLELRRWWVAGRWDGDPPAAAGRPLAVSTVNSRVRAVTRCFRWAAAEQLCPALVWHGLTAIAPLVPGRCAARVPRPISPVPDWVVDATLEFLPPVLRAMVETQRLTGMRSSELCQMTPAAVGRLLGDVWIYSVRQHKGRHHGAEDRPKQIALGPRARAILAPLLAGRPPHAAVFSPAEAQAQRLEARNADRQTPAGQGNEPGTHRLEDPQRTPGEAYTRSSYYRAIQYAVASANRARRAEAKAAGADQWIRVPRWHPHQLRHSAAGSITEAAELRDAAAVLGHETIQMTAQYARDAVERIRLARAIETARKLG